MSADHSPSARIALLPDRGVVAVTGEDAGKFLGGIITNDMDLLQMKPAIFAGLLSPQGKILFEFFIVKADDGYLLDVARDKAADLVKRLTMYRLRAKVSIEDESSTTMVAGAWGEAAAAIAVDGHVFADPRAAATGSRLLISAATPVAAREAIDRAKADVEWRDHVAYDAHRIALGVPEGGKDYDFGDAYPHEANFDVLGGVSFGKGCYVGQEVVARMHHKTVVRKRVVKVESGERDLPATRPEIIAGEAAIGRLGSVAGRHGLALIRLDRAIEAAAKGEAVTSEGIALTIDRAALERYAALARQRDGAT